MKHVKPVRTAVVVRVFPEERVYTDLKSASP